MLVVWLLLVGAYTEAAADGAGVRPTGTFSSLSFHREGGDLLGAEIKIVLTRRGYQGALQIAQGGPSELMIVDLAIEGTKVRFTIPATFEQYGGGTFEGTIDSRGILGRFTIKGVTGDPERLLRGRSYWDIPQRGR